MTVSAARTTKTTAVIGVNTFKSIAAGAGLPRNLAINARIASAIATAICPPSKGSIGNKLKRPTKIFRLATIKIKVPICSDVVSAPLEVT